jgi:RHS repeat-associated protein
MCPAVQSLTHINGFTGKERDAETGLDYFVNRYYSGAQGRFTSPDIAGPRLDDPQSLNRYAYTRNNPLRRVDPDGLYDRDVHMSLTWALGEAAGYGSAQAFGVAVADQGVDDNPATSAAYGGTERQRQANADWHFPSAQRLTDLATETAGALTETSLGQYMHVFQDSFSHAGFTNMTWGHASAGHDPDKTWLRPELANRMAEETYRNLVAAGGALGATGIVVPWSVVAGNVNQFNRANNQKDKDKALAAMRKAIAGYTRKEQERRKKESPLQTGVCSAEFSSCPAQ